MKKSVLLLIFMTCLTWAAGSGHYTWDQSSAEFATILIPAGYTPTINSVEIELGDEIAVFTPTGECAGALIWSNPTGNVAVNAWEDNSSTQDSTEGFKSGDVITFKIWDSSESKEYLAEVEFSVGDGIFARDGYYEISSINVNIPDTTIFDTSWHVISLDTAESVVLNVTEEKDTVISSFVVEHKLDSLFTQKDSLSDGFVFSSDTIITVSETFITIDSSIDTSYYQPDTTVFDTVIYYSSVKQASDSVDTTYSQDLDTIIITITTTIINDTTITQIDSLSDTTVFSTNFDTTYWDTIYNDTTVDTLIYDDPVTIEKEDIELAEKKLSAFAILPSIVDPEKDIPISFYLSKEIALQVETFEITIFDMVGNLLYEVDETQLKTMSDNEYCKIYSIETEKIKNDIRVAGQFLAVVKVRCYNGSVLRYKQFVGIKR